MIEVNTFALTSCVSMSCLFSAFVFRGFDGGTAYRVNTEGIPREDRENTVRTPWEYRQNTVRTPSEDRRKGEGRAWEIGRRCQVNGPGVLGVPGSFPSPSSPDPWSLSFSIHFNTLPFITIPFFCSPGAPMWAVQEWYISGRASVVVADLKPTWSELEDVSKKLLPSPFGGG